MSDVVDKRFAMRYISATVMMATPDRSQTSQRVRVGMIGLAAVLLLIGLAAAVMSTANRDKPVAVAGAARPEVIANIAGPANVTQPAEPLSELGVMPSTADPKPATKPTR